MAISSQSVSAIGLSAPAVEAVMVSAADGLSVAGSDVLLRVSAPAGLRRHSAAGTSGAEGSTTGAVVSSIPLSMVTVASGYADAPAAFRAVLDELVDAWSAGIDSGEARSVLWVRQRAASLVVGVRGSTRGATLHLPTTGAVVLTVESTDAVAGRDAGHQLGLAVDRAVVDAVRSLANAPRDPVSSRQRDAVGLSEQPVTLRASGLADARWRRDQARKQAGTLPGVSS